MPLHAFLDSPVTGVASQKGREGKTPVIAFNHHAAPGAAQAFVIRKKIDASTPDFNRAMDDGASFTKWKLDLWHMPRSGSEFNYLTISLEEAKIAWISLVIPDLQTPEFMNIHEYEDIAFTFKKATYMKKAEPS
jgi:type VI secretion system Hcp family effector